MNDLEFDRFMELARRVAELERRLDVAEFWIGMLRELDGSLREQLDVKFAELEGDSRELA